MNRTLLSILLVVLGLTAWIPASAQREAFPGAEGYGRMTTGGRGGSVYHVTTLEDNNQPGSLRHAVSQKGKRTIVFDVSGTIFLTSELSIQNGDITIAGQTAPGDGICVADYPFTIKASNVIIRFVRFRLGNRQVAFHEGDGLGGMDQSNIIIDHCSVSWSIDECLSVYGSTDITVQWCIASHSLTNAGHAKGSHGYGGNWGGRRASYHHNLVANHTSRTPRLGPRPGTQTEEQMDFRNNVIFNYGSNGCYGGEGMNVNMVNNYYKPGPTGNSRQSRIAGIGIRTLEYCFDKSGTIANFNKVAGTSYNTNQISISRVGGATGHNRIIVAGKSYTIDMESNTIDYEGKPVTVAWNGWKPMLHKWGTLYVDGNYNPSDAQVSADNWTTGIYSQITPSSNDNIWSDDIKHSIKLDTPIDYVYTTTHSAKDAYERVLDYAGTSLKRDEYDKIVTSDVRAGRGSFGSAGIIDNQDQVTYADGSKGWPALNSTEAPKDSDGDGMPDAWETANGLNPSDPKDGAKKSSNGYTNLENYLNSLVEHIIAAQNEGGKMLTGNLESSDPGVELPEYVDDGLTEYAINSMTYLNSPDASTWAFADGFTVSNDKKRTYATGEDLTIRYNASVNFAINIPEGKSVSKVEFTGYSHYANSDCSFEDLNGQPREDLIFPGKESTFVKKTYTVEFPSPVTGSIPFRLSGLICYMSMNLYGSDSSALPDIIAPGEENGDTRVFNIMGMEMKDTDNLAPGIYIRGGKKFLVK